MAFRWAYRHEDRRATLVYLMFPIDDLKTLTREAIKCGRCRANVGEDGRFDVALIRLSDILR